MTSLSAEAMRLIKHFGDFVTVPLAAMVFMDSGRYGSALSGLVRPRGLDADGISGAPICLPSVSLPWASACTSFITTIQTIRIRKDPASATPLLAFPIGLSAGPAPLACGDGSAIFAGLLLGLSGFYHRPLCRAPLDHRAELLALFGKAAAPHASSCRELQFWRIDDFSGISCFAPMPKSSAGG